VAQAVRARFGEPADYPYNYLLYDYSTDPRFYSLINAHTYDYGSLRNIRIVGPHDRPERLEAGHTGLPTGSRSR